MTMYKKIIIKEKNIGEEISLLLGVGYREYIENIITPTTINS